VETTPRADSITARVALRKPEERAGTGRPRRLPRLLGVPDLRPFRAEVKEDSREVDAGDPVDEGVVGLGKERPAVVFEPFDHPHLPEGSVAVELLREDPRDQAQQLALVTGARQRGLPDVVEDVEIGVIDPDRPGGVHRGKRQPLAVTGDEMQATANQVEDVLEGWRRAFEHGHAAHVHVGALVLLGEERRVDGGKPVEMLLGHAGQPNAAGAFTEIA